MPELDQVIAFLERWIMTLRDEPIYQATILAFLLGTAFGWFLSSLRSARKAQGRHQGGSSAHEVTARTTGGKTKEEVERDAHRRL